MFTIKSPLCLNLINDFKNKIISNSSLSIFLSSTVRLFFNEWGMENTQLQSVHLQEVEYLGKDIFEQKC